MFKMQSTFLRIPFDIVFGDQVNKIVYLFAKEYLSVWILRFTWRKRQDRSDRMGIYVLWRIHYDVIQVEWTSLIL